jgi:hypothetical protein
MTFLCLSGGMGMTTTARALLPHHYSATTRFNRFACNVFACRWDHNDDDENENENENDDDGDEDEDHEDDDNDPAMDVNYN